MKRLSYGLVLGIILSAFVFFGYIFHGQYSDMLVGVFYLLISAFLVGVGYQEFQKTKNLKESALTTAVTGLVAAVMVSSAFFLVHNVFFFEQTSKEPEKILGLKNSGLKTMREYLISNNFRVLILSSVLGTIGGFVLGLFGSSLNKYIKNK